MFAVQQLARITHGWRLPAVHDDVHLQQFDDTLYLQAVFKSMFENPAFTGEEKKLLTEQGDRIQVICAAEDKILGTGDIIDELKGVVPVQTVPGNHFVLTSSTYRELILHKLRYLERTLSLLPSHVSQ